MVWPSALADTVTPPMGSPDTDLIAPLSTTSAAAHGEIQAASEIAIAPAKPVKACAFPIVSLPFARRLAPRFARASRRFFEPNRFCRSAVRLAHARPAGGACGPLNADLAP